jgi:hypothetical protein
MKRSETVEGITTTIRTTDEEERIEGAGID